MKFLKIIFAVFVALLLIFFSLGFFKPSFEYASAINVNAAPEKCWSVYMDTTRRADWLPGFKALELKSGTWQQAGSVYELVLVQDKEYRMSETLTSISPPVKVAYELHNEVMTSAYQYDFEKTANGTHVSVHYKVTGNNPVWKSILFLSSSYLESASMEQLQSLKKEIEKDHL